MHLNHIFIVHLQINCIVVREHSLSNTYSLKFVEAYFWTCRLLRSVSVLYVLERASELSCRRGCHRGECHCVHSGAAQSTFVPLCMVPNCPGRRARQRLCKAYFTGEGTASQRRKAECPKSRSSHVTGTCGGM